MLGRAPQHNGRPVTVATCEEHGQSVRSRSRRRVCRDHHGGQVKSVADVRTRLKQTSWRICAVDLFNNQVELSVRAEFGVSSGEPELALKPEVDSGCLPRRYSWSTTCSRRRLDVAASSK